MVKGPPANAGDGGSVPGPGRPHLPRGSEARALEPPRSNYWSPQAPKREEPLEWEAQAPQLECISRSPQLEKARVQP